MENQEPLFGAAGDETAPGTAAAETSREEGAAAEAAAEAAGPPPGVTQEERTWAMLAYALNLVGPVVAPLAVYFLRRDRSRFVAFHALQSLFLNLALILVSIAAIALAFVVQTFPIAGWIMSRQLMVAPWVMWGAVFVATVIGSIKAFDGKEYLLPVVGDCALRQLDE